MPTRLSSLLPPRGRVIEPGDATIVPTTDELQIHAVAATARMLAVSGAVLCLGVVACLWSSVPSSILVPWAFLTLLALLPAPLVLRDFERRVLTSEEAARLRTWIIGLSVLRALTWGIGAAVFFHFASPAELLLLGVLVVGNAMGTGAALMAIPLAATAFALCTVTPLAVSLAASGEMEHMVAAALLVVYALGQGSAARQVFLFVRGEADLRKALLEKQRELIRAKIEAETASRTKTDFLAHMSHELRTPLNAIIGFSETIASLLFGRDVDRYADYAKDINTSGRHLLRVINDMLDLAKIEAGALTVSEQPFDLAAALASVELLLRERVQRKRLHLTWDLPAGLPRITSDERLVQQILINVLTNAVKFTGEGGKICVAVRRRGGDDGLAVSIRDTGTGMRPEDIATALKPFGQVSQDMTARGEGTGLGLPLCQRFAQALGATFTIDSVYGEGTTVTLTLPARCLDVTAPQRAALSA
jgi:signal transduction histidine kinase